MAVGKKKPVKKKAPSNKKKRKSIPRQETGAQGGRKTSKKAPKSNRASERYLREKIPFESTGDDPIGAGDGERIGSGRGHDDVSDTPLQRLSAWSRPDGSRPLRFSNRTTIEIRQRLNELGCDPLDYAVMFLRGDESPNTHPFLSVFKNFCFYLRKYSLTPSAQNLIAHYEMKANEALGPGTWLDPKIRAKIATDLMAYVYPKLQSIETTHKTVNDVDPEKPVHEMTDEELRVLAINIVKEKVIRNDIDQARRNGGTEQETSTDDEAG